MPTWDIPVSESFVEFRPNPDQIPIGMVQFESTHKNHRESVFAVNLRLRPSWSQYYNHGDIFNIETSVLSGCDPD